MRVLLVLLLLIPLAQATISNPDGDHEALLYLHVNGSQEMQLSPLAPPVWFEHERSPSAIGQSGCVETPGQSMTNQQIHTWYGVVAPGWVAYDETGQTKPLLERGIRDDLRLVDRPMMLDWFVRAKAPDAQAGVAPRVVLEATIREGDDISVDDAALNAGRIIAHAATEEADLSPALSGHPHVSYDEESQLFHFRVPLPPEAAMIPQRESFNLRIDMYVRHPYCDTTDRYAMPDLVSILSLPDHRPALSLGVQNPVAIDRLSAVVDDGLVRFQADVRAVFGAGDAMLVDAPMRIQGPSDAATVSNTSWGEGHHDHDRTFPVRAGISYQGLHAWAYEADAAASGTYNASLVVRTASGAEARAVVPFGLGSEEKTCTVLATGEPSCSIEPKSDKRTPAPLVPLALLAAAWLRRR